MYSDNFFIQFFVTLLCLVIVRCMKLPDYIKPCSRNDPNLATCALESARASIQPFSLGDAERHFQSLDPLVVDEMRVSISQNKDGLNVIFKDNYFTGLSNLRLDSLNFDLENRIITTEGLVNLVIKSKYEISGKILVIPVTGNGDSVIKLKNTTLDIKYKYDIVEGADGKEHWKIIHNEIKYDVNKAVFKLDNLFNADKRIGDQINRILNEMSREIVAEVGPKIAKALGDAVLLNLETLLDQVPFDEFMPK